MERTKDMKEKKGKKDRKKGWTEGRIGNKGVEIKIEGSIQSIKWGRKGGKQRKEGWKEKIGWKVDNKDTEGV